MPYHTVVGPLCQIAGISVGGFGGWFEVWRERWDGCYVQAGGCPVRTAAWGFNCIMGCLEGTCSCIVFGFYREVGFGHCFASTVLLVS